MQPTRPARALRALTCAAVTLTSLLSAAAPDLEGQAPQATATVAGTVSEVGSSQPVPHALVRATSGPSALTNASGQFRLTGVAPGPVTLEITALAYRAASVQVSALAGSEIRVAVTLEAEPLEVERLIVTADKAARSSLEVGALTSVVDREDVEARGDLELVDALENEVGVVHSAQAGSFESIELRGMPRGGNEFETTLLLVDGVPQTDSRNSARVINLPIDNADAVEIVRGPNSALYGRTAIGGAINVITAQPTAVPRATAEVQAGGFGHRRAALAASGPVEDWGGYYFSWSATSNEGFYRRDPSYDVDETSVFGKLTFAPDPRTHAMISVNSVVSDNSLPTSVPVVSGELLSDVEPGFGILDNINLPSAAYHHEELRITTNVVRELAPWASLTNVLAYRDIQNGFEESGDIIGAPFDLAANTLTMYPFSLETDEEVFYEEARLALTPRFGGMDHQILLGASFERTTGFRLGDLIYTDDVTFGMPIDFLNPAPPPRSDWEYFQFGGDDYSLSALGLYYQYQVSPLPRIQLTAAGRFDRLDLENAETLQAGVPSIDETFDAFSPKLSALVRVLDGNGAGALGDVRANVYATYSQAFKPPRTPSSLNPAGTDPPLDPEDITNIEVGVKSAFAGGRASLEATYFHMQRDGIVVSTRQGPFFLPSNAGRQDFDGVELAAAWAPTPRLEVTANSVFYHNRFGDFVIQTSGGDTDLTGNRLPLVPDRIFNVSGTLSPAQNVRLTVGLKHVGDRFLDQLNAYRLDSYALLDASVSWSPGPVRITVSAHNLLDRRYFGNGDTSLAESVEPGAPRQIVIGAAFRHD